MRPSTPPPPVTPAARSEYADLTEAVVRNAAPPPDGQRFLRDARLPGFALRITAGGVKSWIVEARVKNLGRTVRRTLGRYPALSADKARAAAIQELGRYADGVDRLAEARANRVKGVTLAAVLDDYLAARRLKPSTVADYRQVFQTAFADWADKPILGITRNMVEHRYERDSLRSKSRASYAMRLLRALFNFAAAKYETEDGEPLVTDNPVKRLSATQGWNRIERRRNLIRLHQLPAWFDGLDYLRDAGGIAPLTADYFEFLIFTGCRRREGLTLRWDDIDLPGRLFRLRDTKNREDHELPLSDRLVDLLKGLQAAADPDQPLVFAAGREPLLDHRYWQKKLIAKSKVTFTPHDLRRTFATVAEGLEISTYTLKRLMNHLTGADVTAGYVQIDVERLRGPMQRITDTILTAAGRKEPPANVLTFPGASKAA